MATAKLPFKGESSVGTIDSILHETAALPRELNPKIPVDLERIINQCMEKGRELRYQHASDLRAELQRLKRDTDSGRFAVRESRTRRTDPHSAEAKSTWSKKRVLALSLAAAALVVVTFGAVRLLNHTRDVRWARTVALPQISQLFDEGNLGKAYAFAEKSETQNLHGGHECESLLLRSAQPLAARNERKYQPLAATIPAEENRPFRLCAIRPRQHRAASKSTSAKNLRFRDSRK